jgi:hypothetical protein
MKGSTMFTKVSKALNWAIISLAIALGTLTLAQKAGASEPRTPVVQKASVSSAAASGVTSAATVSTSVTVPGARLGDACLASHSVDATGLVISCKVTATDTAIVTYVNHTTNGVAVTSGTARVFLFPKGTR